MGPSGSGKSTLMNLLGCLDGPTAGSYRLAGQEVAGLSRAELAAVRNRMLGFVFQSFNLLAAHQRPRERRAAAALRRRRPARERRAARRRRRWPAWAWASALDHQPNQLSGGQQQRVAIARALVNRPRILLADEPTGNLDSRTSLEIMALFQRLSRAGITIVLVTHEPDIAAFASRVLVIRDGRVVSDDAQTPVQAMPLPARLRPRCRRCS